MKKKVLSLLLAVVMIVGMIPSMALTAFAEENEAVAYLYSAEKPDGTGRYYEVGEITDYEVIDSEHKNTVLWGEWYVVKGEVTFNERLWFRNHANLILTDGCRLICERGIEAFHLTIYSQSTDGGTIISYTATIGNAGIGSESDEAWAVNVTIHGGNVNANGGYGAAGIGGGAWGGNCGNVTIYGGTVTAGGGEYAAGIGGGRNGNCGNVTICGGTVTANGGHRGAGIGSGTLGNVDGVTIEGGVVTANGGEDGAGIGSGFGGNAGSITIHGGVINANGASSGAGIGGGHGGSVNSVTVCDGSVIAIGGSGGPGIGGEDCSGSSVTISGGNITASGGKNAAGIGGGYRGNGGTVTVSDGRVTAIGGEYGSGIGGGRDGNGGTVTVSGGKISASGGYQAAGIGGGRDGSGGNVTVSDGHVIAIGSESGSGIGGGYRGNGGTVTISGGNISASGGDNASGIGGGDNGAGGNVTVRGGTVTAKGLTGIGNGYGGSDGRFTLYDGSVEAQGIDNAGISGTFVAHNYRKFLAGSSSKYAKDSTPYAYISSREPYVAILNHYVLDENADNICDNCGKELYVERTLDDNNTVVSTVAEIPSDAKMITSDTDILEGGWYVAEGNVNISGQIEVKGIPDKPTRIILKDGCYFSVDRGIILNDGKELIIYGQSGETGTLFVNPGVDGPGIGGSYGAISGNVTFCGGNVVANGGEHGAGIGSAGWGTGCNVTVYGGNVTANGGKRAAGIGGGFAGNAGSIIVYGGNVMANGGEEVAGIGSGFFKMPIDNIALGNNVVLKAGANEPLVEMSPQEYYQKLKDDDVINCKCVSISKIEVASIAYYTERIWDYENKKITESSCLVPADASKITADTKTLGGGWYTASGNVVNPGRISVTATPENPARLVLKDGCNLTVDGGIQVNEGKVLIIYEQTDSKILGKLIANGSNHCAGIGSGWNADCGLVEIKGGHIEAVGGNALDGSGNYGVGGGAGIGGGENGSAGTQENGGGVFIYGGKITARGGTLSAGIGGGYGENIFSGEVTICGGDVKAFGGERSSSGGGAGIGSGWYGIGDTVTINGGNVEATGGSGAAGIGGGMNGMGCILTVNGGTVSAYGGKNATGIGSGVYGFQSYDEGGELYFYGGDLTAVGNGTNAHGIGASYGGSVNGIFDVMCDDGDADIIAGDDAEHWEKVTEEEYDSARNTYVNISNHSYTSGIYKDNGDGTHLAKCLHCDLFGNVQFHMIGDYAPNHDATCTLDETETGHCSLCNATDTKSIFNTAKGHSFTSDVYIDNGDGTHSVKCIRCEEGGEPEPHNFINGECVCGAVHIHDFTGEYRVNGDGTHSRKCTKCDEYGETEKHEFADDGNWCKICGAFVPSCNIVSESTTELTEGKWLVKSNVSIDKALTVKGNVSLYLSDGYTLTATKGIILTEGNTLTIYAQINSDNIGKIVATGDKGAAGIGGDISNSDAGTLVINGGSITATGGLGAVGIGGGLGGNGGKVTVNGGIVIATAGVGAVSGQGGAGIGGGLGGNSAVVTISDDLAVYDSENHIVTLPEGSSWGELLNGMNVAKIARKLLALDVAGKAFTVTPNGKNAGTGIVMVALYDSADMNRLLDVKVFELAKTDDLTGTFTKNGYVRAYWWSDFEKMIPLCARADGTIAE